MTARKRPATPIKLDGGARLFLKFDQQYADGKHLLGRFRVSVTNAKPPLMLNGPPQNIAAIVAIATDKRTAERYIRSGLLDEKAYTKHVQGLPDLAEKAEPVETVMFSDEEEDDEDDGDLEDAGEA